MPGYAKNQKLATKEQVAKLAFLFEEAGLPLGAAALRKFKTLTASTAYVRIETFIATGDTLNLMTYVAPEGHATAKQLRYYSKLKSAFSTTPTPAEIETMKVHTIAAMQAINVTLMRDLQDQRDREGLPLPAWRLERGLYDSEVLREGQRAAAARQAAKREAKAQAARARWEALDPIKMYRDPMDRN